MGVGSIFFGIALLLVVVAYLVRPFRVARAGAGLDRAIEAWVAQVRAKGQGSRGAEDQAGQGAGKQVNFCPQCGQRVSPDDRFCAQCGAPLGEGE
jgi:hypothetical protein